MAMLVDAAAVRRAWSKGALRARARVQQAQGQRARAGGSPALGEFAEAVADAGRTLGAVTTVAATLIDELHAQVEKSLAEAAHTGDAGPTDDAAPRDDAGHTGDAGPTGDATHTGDAASTEQPGAAAFAVLEPVST